ncbi:MAG TPA: hypothetical protein VJH33_03095 [Candidatus Paceibacterota bacterium]
MWWHGRSLVFISVALAAVLLVGFLIVRSRTAYTNTNTPAFWGSAYGTFAPNTSERAGTEPTIPKQYQPFKYVTQFALQLPEDTDTVVEGSEPVEYTDTFDYEAFLASLKPTSYPVSETDDPSFIADVYALLPQGLVSTTTAQRRTSIQQALYEYGNEVGGFIDSFDSAYQDQQVAILDDYHADPENPEKQEPMRLLAQSIAHIGLEMTRMEPEFIPKTMSAPHALLAQRYQEAGRALEAIIGTKTDEELLARIEEYNATADALGLALVNLLILFESAGVGFASYDPGSVFTFSPILEF